MATLYRARWLLCSAQQLIDGGAILAERGRILEVGSFHLLRKSAPDAALVDYGEAVLLPTFINAHTHLELSHYPKWAAPLGYESEPESFVDWILRLIQVKRRIEPERMGEVMRASIVSGIEQCLAAGTAAVGDILSWYPGRSIHADSPLRGRIFLESLGQDPQLCAHNYRRLDQSLQQGVAGMFPLGISPHSPYTISAAYMEQLFARCREQGLAGCIHISESPAEVEFLDSGCGALVEQLYPAVAWQEYRPPARRQRPIAYLAARGGLTDQQLLVHGVQLDPAEIAQIAAAGTSLVLCPRSNARLQVGTAPVAQLKGAGVALALGTDSLASNDSLSLWDELACAAELYADAFSPVELFGLATRGGAQALGLQDELGALEPGMRCSFQLVGSPAGMGRSITAPQLIEGLIAGGIGARVDSLVLDGQSVL